MRTVQDGVEGVVRCECWKESRIGRLLEYGRIPERYAAATLDSFEASADQYPHLHIAKLAAEAYAREYPLASNGGLMFMGPPGLGKTHLALGIMRKLIVEKGVRCLFFDFSELIHQIQWSFNPQTPGSEKLILAPVFDADVLVLDDLGAMKITDWVQNQVGFIINNRYTSGKATIFTTNYFDPDDKNPATASVIGPNGEVDRFKLQQLRELGLWDDGSLGARIGVRTRSRLAEMCKLIQMAGEDYRKKIAAHRDRHDFWRQP